MAVSSLAETESAGLSRLSGELRGRLPTLSLDLESHLILFPSYGLIIVDSMIGLDLDPDLDLRSTLRLGRWT